ncbi:plasmid replication DNA-binding protein KfrA [Azospirillum brasilense]|uniref:Plasmid replication DNA-binding protein KfrA n=1 Tax=Azospirillum brasilense TaxID=192 RepID=A0A560APB8_AZOBR|nr:DNA-binding protein [Azospirillum brasilense]TWA62129.1 plasmid replication DNA-binding protein KfrA [Azospirillum brasilense]
MAQKATQAAVQAAYHTLVAQGIPPTYDAVRNQIGGGSMTTINRHLREIAAASSPPMPPSPVPSAPLSEEAPVELPLEWLQVVDGLSRTVASILTRTIADERQRAAQLLAAEAETRAAAVAAARAQTEELRRTLEESRGRTDADLDAAAEEVEMLQGNIATLLAAVELESSDDPDDLSAAAAHAVNRIRELTGMAARIPALEAELEQRISDIQTAEARMADLQDAANRAERRHQELLGTASRVPTLEAAVQAAEARIAGLSAQLVASAETAGRANALGEVVVQLTTAMTCAAAPPAAPPAQPRSRRAKRAAAAATAARAEKNGAAPPPEPETTSADQPLANLVLTAPSPADGGSSDAPPPLAAA